MEVDSSRYYETGNLNVGIGDDGMPIVLGGEPQGPDEGLTDENLVCGDAEEGAATRPPCQHFGAVLLPADGLARGFGEMRQIRRFCLRLSTASELFEITTNIYACTLRAPKDGQSNRLINDFEERQKLLAHESAETSGSLDF